MHSEKTKTTNSTYPGWALGPFTRIDDANPILGPGEATFRCPFLGETAWEEAGIFNPSAIVRDGRVYVIYRAAGSGGAFDHVNRLGLAWSDDGVRFERHPEPILFPEPGPWQDIEFGSGIQDPRVVETEEGGYVLTYALFDGEVCTMAVATSGDLFHWEKRGLAFARAYGGKYGHVWSKAGAIVCRREGERMVAARIGGRYWMYWGESDVYAATSDDLIHWEPVEFEVEARKRIYRDEETGIWRGGPEGGRRVLKPVLTPRPGRFDGSLVEPGPQALLTEQGILLIYDGCNDGDPDLPPGAYSAGQALFDPVDPTAVIGRMAHPFLAPARPFELEGPIPNVCFAEGLIYFRGQWLLYYGAVDRFVGVAQSANTLPRE